MPGWTARDINDAGTVAGDTSNTAGWTWNNGAFTSLNGAVAVRCIAPNGVVGGKTSQGPTLWSADGEVLFQLGYSLPNDPPGTPLHRFPNSLVQDYRGSYALTGGSEGANVWVPYLFSQPSPLGGFASQGLAIDVDNIVVGSFNDGNLIPCFWSPPSWFRQVLPHGPQSDTALDIGTSGIVYGVSDNRACRWVGGVREFLAPAGSSAKSVASNGDVLIDGLKAIWSQGVLTMIDPLLPPGIVNWSPIAINANRQVLAQRMAGAGPVQTYFIINLPSHCPADANNDEAITPADVAVFVGRWFASLQAGTTAGDFDGNCIVNPADVAAFVTSWFDALLSGC